jgi:hypothetical protein
MLAFLLEILKYGLDTLHAGKIMPIFEKFAKKSSENLYLVFRVLIGLMFLSHGCRSLAFSAEML